MKTLSLLAAIFLAGLSSTFAADHIVEVFDTEFSPRTVNAAPGDTITWVLQSGQMGHNVTSVKIPRGATPWSSPVNTSNPTFQIQLTVPGTYRYHCTIHLFMKGIIRVSSNQPTE